MARSAGIPFYTSSRSGARAARDPPVCYSLSLTRGFLVISLLGMTKERDTRPSKITPRGKPRFCAKTMPSPSGVSRALCASPRCGVRAQRTEVFAIAGKNRDRWRRCSLRRRDRGRRGTRLTDEGSNKETIPVLSPSSVPSGQLPPKGKPYALPIMPQGKSHLSAAVLNLPTPRLMRKGECAGAINVANRPRRGKLRGQAQPCPRGVPPLTTFFRVSSRKNV